MSIIRVFIYIFAIIIYTSPNAQAFEVQNVRFGYHPNKVRMVLDISSVKDFRVFVLKNPHRIVIDLPTFTWGAGRVNKSPKTNISNIRQGKLTKDISRIVFDLKQPIIVQSAFLLPKQNGKENRIVIDYKTVSLKELQNHKSIIHGTLKVDKQKHIINQINRPTSSNTAKAQKKPLIIIDPGHGGTDPGTVSKYTIYEKDLVLPIAKELKKQLLSTGRYRVLLTRENDRFIRLKNRVKFARDHQGDLFISLHVNSNKDRHAHGASIYTLSKKASDAQTAKLAEKENQADLLAGVDFNVEDEQVAFILGDFLMNDTMNQSKFFANTVVSNIRNSGVRLLNNPHRYAGFAVLKAPEIPSILIETGFSSNKSEARLLNQPAHRKKLSRAIVSSINSYFRGKL